MTVSDSVRAGEDLHDATSSFRDQPQSLSSIEWLLTRVDEIADRLVNGNVTNLHSVRADLLAEPEPRRSIR